MLEFCFLIYAGEFARGTRPSSGPWYIQGIDTNPTSRRAWPKHDRRRGVDEQTQQALAWTYPPQQKRSSRTSGPIACVPRGFFTVFITPCAQVSGKQVPTPVVDDMRTYKQDIGARGQTKNSIVNHTHTRYHRSGSEQNMFKEHSLEAVP